MVPADGAIYDSQAWFKTIDWGNGGINFASPPPRCSTRMTGTRDLCLSQATTLSSEYKH